MILGIRETLLLLYISLNILVYASTHALSVWHGLTERNVLLFWTIVLAGSSGLLLKAIKTGRLRILPSAFQPLDLMEIFFISATAFFVLISLVSVICAAPYSIDALIYHLPSAMHWIQDKTVGLYPTHTPRQIMSPPLSSFVQLHLFLLSGNDRWANVPQFISMVLGLAGLSLLCPYAGVLTRKGTLCAVFIAVSLPLGVLQASSPLNDYDVSFWVISFILFFYKHLRTKTVFDLTLASICFAFAFLTKTSGFIISLPILFYFIGAESKNKAFIKNLSVFGGIFLVLALPFLWQMCHVLPLFKSPYANSPSMNFSLSYPQWDLIRNVLRHTIMEATYYKSNEMAMPNPLHFIGIVGTGLWLAFKYKDVPVPTRVYSLLLAAGFLTLCLLAKASLWASRFHLPFLILFCPLMALVLLKTKRLYKAAVLAFFCFSVFTVIIFAGRYPFDPKIKTLLAWESQFKRGFFPDGINFYEASRDASILSCPNIGLKAYGSGDQKEYILWQMMRRKNITFRIEHVDVQNYSKNFPYPLGPFDPCAIILTKLDGNLPPHITLNKPFRLFKDHGNTGLYVE